MRQVAAVVAGRRERRTRLRVPKKAWDHEYERQADGRATRFIGVGGPSISSWSMLCCWDKTLIVVPGQVAGRCARTRSWSMW